MARVSGGFFLRGCLFLRGWLSPGVLGSSRQPRGGRNRAPRLLPPCQGPDLGEQQHRPHLMALTKLGGRQAVLVLVVPWLGSIGVPAGSRVPHPLGISCLSHVYLGCPAWGRCQCLPLNFPRHRSPAWPCPELIPALLGAGGHEQPQIPSGSWRAHY